MYAPTPLSIGQLLDQGFHIYGATLRSVWPLSLAAGLVPALPVVVFQLISDAGSMGGMTLVAVSLLGALLISIFLTVVLLLRIDTLVRAQAPPWVMTFRQARERFVPMLLGSLLYMVAVLVGLVLLLVPGLILMVSLWIFQAAVVLDSDRPLQALQRSHRLVWGNWWRTAIILSIPTVIFLALYAMMGMVVGVLLVLGGLGDAVAGKQALFMVVDTLVQGVASALLMPLFYAINLSLFHDLKLRKEGIDLAARISTLGA